MPIGLPPATQQYELSSMMSANDPPPVVLENAIGVTPRRHQRAPKGIAVGLNRIMASHAAGARSNPHTIRSRCRGFRTGRLQNGGASRKSQANIICLSQSALYRALHKLEQQGWIEAEWAPSENNRRAKYYYYRLTSAGRKALKTETAQWERLSAAISLIVKPT
jgi:hypothetical protein